MEYSAAFRKRMVERMMGPRAMSAMTLSAEVGVGQPTLSRWLRDASILARVFGMKDKDPKPLSMWTSKEKLHAIVEAAHVPEDQLGGFLRSRGLRTADLEALRADAESGLATTPRSKLTAAEKKRFKQLERELARTKAALAEAAAILVLRKKALALWGEEGDDT